MRRFSVLILCVLGLIVLPARQLSAQSADRPWQAAAHLATIASSEFDSTDVGVGGRLSWSPFPLVGLEGEFTFYPRDFADEPAFSGSRVEGLFGATLGPRLGAVRLFAKLRPGFVAFSGAPEPFACILIFPPPLNCTMASGPTVFAVDIGGGVEWFPTDRTVVRLDVGDRAIRYPGPAFDRDRNVHDEDFFGHDLRVSIGGGWRF